MTCVTIQKRSNFIFGVLIWKKMNQDYKDYQRVQFFELKNNGNTGENVQWSLLQLNMDT